MYTIHGEYVAYEYKAKTDKIGPRCTKRGLAMRMARNMARTLSIKPYDHIIVLKNESEVVWKK